MTEDGRPSWDQTWMDVADTVAKRSRCERDQVGAVIVTGDERIHSTGYNGPPSGYPTAKTSGCLSWCPKAMSGSRTPDYSECPALHAEANAVARADWSAIHGGTIYISSSACVGCARLIANTGIKKVVMRVLSDHAHRDPEGVTALMRSCGLTVAWV